MSLKTQQIENIFNQAYCELFPLNGVTTKGPLSRLDKTWQEVLAENLLPRLLRHLRLGLIDSRILWLEMGEDPYSGSKPFTIIRIGVETDGSLAIIVKGQKTKRICKKWSKKLGKFFSPANSTHRLIHLIWEETRES